MNSRLWKVLSYIPGTEQHDIYDGTLLWFQSFNEILAHEGWPTVPPIPRDPHRCQTAIRIGVAVLWALNARDRGCTDEECYAVLVEHLPASLES